MSTCRTVDSIKFSVRACSWYLIAIALVFGFIKNVQYDIKLMIGHLALTV